MDDKTIQRERAQNLWTSFQRKHEGISRGAEIIAKPDTPFDAIGGLAQPKEELLNYACAATSPEFYGKWGTYPPTGILLIGHAGTGKSLLVQALATATETSYVRVDVPRLVIDMMHAGGKVGEFVQAWTQALEEMPPLTIFFDELEFSQAQEIGALRRDLPIGPIMDFLLELIDRAIAAEGHLMLAATSHPDTLRPAFLTPRRFERIVEVTPIYPGDVVAALAIHAEAAEKRAGRPLFGEVDWPDVVGTTREISTGDWIRLLHAVLRSKARAEAAGETVEPVTSADLAREVSRFTHAKDRVQPGDGGNYV